MSENWISYMETEGESPAAVMVDLAMVESAPDTERPCLLTVLQRYADPTAQSELWLEQGQEALEDMLIEAIGSHHNGCFVGHRAQPDQYAFYFYVPRDEDCTETVGRATEPYGDFDFQVKVEPDEDWTCYLEDLCPTAEQYQVAQNHLLIAELTKHGDCLEKPRPVSHWAYFKSPQQRARFAAAAAEKGFEVKDESEAEGEEEFPFGVIVERVDPVVPEAIDEVVLALYRLADGCGGTYDGWETGIESEADT